MVRKFLVFKGFLKIMKNSSCRIQAIGYFLRVAASDNQQQTTTMKMTANQPITESAKTFGVENWPATGPVWIQTDRWGNALGWATKFSAHQCRALQAQVATARAEWDSAQVGATVTIPAGFHPRHGIKTATYFRVR